MENVNNQIVKIGATVNRLQSVAESQEVKI